MFYHYSYNRKGLKSQHGSHDSSEMSWKTHKKNIQYSDENYNSPRTSQLNYPNAQLNKSWQNSLQGKCVAEIAPVQDNITHIQNNITHFKEQDSLLASIDQNRISSPNVTNFESIAEPRLKKTEAKFSNQKGNSYGSKWDQFIEEDKEPDNSDDEYAGIPDVVQPQDDEIRRLHNKLFVCGGKRSGDKSLDYGSFKKSNLALFSVDDLDDSDYNI
jgi:hypothetical protein